MKKWIVLILMMSMILGLGVPVAADTEDRAKMEHVLSEVKNVIEIPEDFTEFTYEFEDNAIEKDR